MIRYVDSAGWTWEVCELADRRAADTPRAAGDARQPTSRTEGARVVQPGLADRPDPGDHPHTSLGALGELYFMSRVGTRKLRDYPATWTQLSRTGLEALCDRAQELGVAAAG